MVSCGHADAMVTGNTRHYAATVEKLMQSVGPRENELVFGMCILSTKEKQLLLLIQMLSSIQILSS